MFYFPSLIHAGFIKELNIFYAVSDEKFQVLLNRKVVRILLSDAKEAVELDFGPIHGLKRLKFQGAGAEK
jgi:hypothetical protein